MTNSSPPPSGGEQAPRPAEISSQANTKISEGGPDQSDAGLQGGDRLEAWYSMNKGLTMLVAYTLALGGAIYIVGTQLVNLGIPKFLVFLFGLAFMYLLALQLRTFLAESRAKEPVFILTEQGIKLRPLKFQTIAWKDLSKIEIHNKSQSANPLAKLFAQSGFVSITVKPNAKLAPTIAEWTKGKGEANEFFLSANMMQTNISDMDAFLRRHAPGKLIKVPEK